MDEKQNLTKDCGCNKELDRYISFDGIDCDGNARRMMSMIELHLPEAGASKPFWEYFMAKRTPRSGPPPDDLFLVHSHLNQIREFFEERGDAEALELLFKLEEECC
jgi:hypothetical protein